jgi:phosphatidylglycerol:prolipoprotein diacylglycerol transferase
MIHFLHTFSPTAILFSFGSLAIHWYGLFLVLAMIAAMLVAIYLGQKYNIKKDDIFDLSFYLILGGLLGARIYDIFLELPYYIQHPWQTLKIWEGGLAIHGGIIAGLIILVIFAKRKKINFWTLTAIITPALALGQAIGRWGNYFNQELYGLPTNLPWGIPIDTLNRPVEFIGEKYFQPTFLYESLGSLLIFLALLIINWTLLKNKESSRKINGGLSILPLAFYVILYSILRFCLEFIRIDAAPNVWGWRWPQIISLALIFFILILIFYKTCISDKKNLLK